MTVTHPTRFACAVLIGLVLLVVDAIPTAAHAQLESSDPADNAEVAAPFNGPIALTFDAPLASGSKAELKGPDGSTIASARVAGDRLLFTLDGALMLGSYTIQWTSVGVDRGVERGTLTFTVVVPPPTPRPTPTPSATARATARPPTQTGSGTPAGGTSDVLFPLLAAVIAIGAIGALLLNLRRQSSGR